LAPPCHSCGNPALLCLCVHVQPERPVWIDMGEQQRAEPSPIFRREALLPLHLTQRPLNRQRVDVHHGGLREMEEVVDAGQPVRYFGVATSWPPRSARLETWSTITRVRSCIFSICPSGAVSQRSDRRQKRAYTAGKRGEKRSSVKGKRAAAYSPGKISSVRSSGSLGRRSIQKPTAAATTATA